MRINHTPAREYLKWVVNDFCLCLNGFYVKWMNGFCAQRVNHFLCTVGEPLESMAYLNGFVQLMTWVGRWCCEWLICEVSEQLLWMAFFALSVAKTYQFVYPKQLLNPNWCIYHILYILSYPLNLKTSHIKHISLYIANNSLNPHLKTRHIKHISLYMLNNFLTQTERMNLSHQSQAQHLQCFTTVYT